jgi:NAD(P)-dependent dehydrogenase (short-subunit alcohol dehydrogenase family)
VNQANQAEPADQRVDQLNDLTGKVAVVTGAGSGMGKATVERLGECRAKVVAVDIDLASAEAVVKALPGGTGVAVQADVSDEASTRAYAHAAVDAFGYIDYFFSNAGILGPGGPLLEATLEDWHRTMGVNLIGTFLGVREIGRLMVDRGQGSIVVTASIAGLRSSPGVPLYSISKAGVISLVRNAARELGPRGVRINAICPAATETNFGNGAMSPEVKAHMASRVPLGRVGEADDMARAVLWLFTDSASYINGAVIPVDGGQEA